jgi:hypothetical protein
MEAAFAHVRGVPSSVVDEAILATGVASDLASARRAYASLLARAQLTDEEVMARIVHMTHADLYPAAPLDRAATMSARLLGRGDLALRAFRAAVGDTVLGKDEWAALKEVAYQHAGWTREGFDLHVRAVAEGGERRLAIVPGTGT